VSGTAGQLEPGGGQPALAEEPPATVDKAATRWWMLTLLSVAIAGNYYAYDSIAPVADLLRSTRGFTQQQIGLLNAVFSLPNIALALVGGILIDRFGPSRVALWTAGLCCVGTV